jgi:hypothetical protein
LSEKEILIEFLIKAIEEYTDELRKTSREYSNSNNKKIDS